MMSTLTKNKYNRLSKEELILLLEARDNERKADTGSSFAEASNIKRIISEVLVLLFNEERQPIEKAMSLLLNFFNADWGYVAIFEKDLRSDERMGGSPQREPFGTDGRDYPLDHGNSEGRT